MTRICPKRMVWSKLFRQLERHSRREDCPPPPTPLILSGWAFSNDIEKKQRWEETVEWASAHGCAHLLEALSDSDFYEVTVPTAYTIGPGGGPLFLPWSSEPKQRPPSTETERLLSQLRTDWSRVVGEALATVTRPVRFTGLKRRRLLVWVLPDARAPWGTWSTLSSSETERREFTRFREAVNQAIAPRKVDHIEFTSDPPGAVEGRPDQYGK